MTDQPAEAPRRRAIRRLLPWLARGLCILFLAGTFADLYAWCHRKGWSHDEVENIHAGWLVYKGQAPYTDFFHHKPPFYWQFVSLYFRFAGEDLAVMLWARHWMLATFLAAVLFTFLVGRELFDEWSGWAAAGILACNSLIHYPAIEPREQGWMLAFLMAGLYVFLRAWRRSFPWHQGLLAGLLLGSAYAMHPRAGHPILALALATAFHCQFQAGWHTVLRRKTALALFVGACLAVVAIPYALFGFRFHHLLYSVSLRLAGEDCFAPWSLMRNLYLSTYAMMPLLPAGAAAALVDLRNRETRFPAFAVLAFFLLGNVQVMSNPRPFVQAFYSLGPFAALLCAAGVAWLVRRLTTNQSAVLVTCLLAGGFLSNLNPPYAFAPDEYTVCETRAQKLLAAIPPGERYVGMNSHPLFRQDGTFYWFAMNHVMRSLQLLDPAFRHDFVAEFERTRPFMMGEDVLRWVEYDPEQRPALEAFIAAHYVHLPNAPFFVRKDAPAASDP